MSKHQDPWAVPDRLAEARALYADLEEPRCDVDREAREMARAQRANSARLRSTYWIRQAESLYEAIIDAHIHVHVYCAPYQIYRAVVSSELGHC